MFFTRDTYFNSTDVKMSKNKNPSGPAAKPGLNDGFQNTFFAQNKLGQKGWASEIGSGQNIAKGPKYFRS